MRPGRTAAIGAAGIVLCAIVPAESLAHAHASSAPADAPAPAGAPADARVTGAAPADAHVTGAFAMDARVMGAAPTDARVTGAFAMLARVTTTENVRGEHVGELLRRRWFVSPQSCTGNVCQALDLDRERSAGIDESLALHRVAAGTYAGSGSFYVALRCKHKTYPHGSRAPYRITLTISSAVTVQGIAFARRITATYHNSRRSDSTPCVLGPSHDAARYTGSATSAIPTPPAG